MLINSDRLDAYRRLLAQPLDSRIGHTITQPGKPLADHLPDLKAHFVRYLMERQLEREGDL